MNGTPLKCVLLLLQDLNLNFSRIDDRALNDIASLGKLEKLYLQKTGITNRGLLQLRDLPNLRKIDVWGTDVTRDGIEKTGRARPQLEVIH